MSARRFRWRSRRESRWRTNRTDPSARWTAGGGIDRRSGKAILKSVTSHPAFAALTGTLFMLPLLVANTIVGNRIEPFFSLIRPGLHTSPREHALLVFVLLLLPAGAFIALRPVLNRRQRRPAE